MSKVAGYARVSTNNQSTKEQETRLKKYADYLGKEIDIYAEKVSGAKSSRPELQKLLANLDSYEAVIVTDIDRLARSLKDLIELTERFKETHKDFIALDNSIDTSTPEGQLQFHIMASLAEFERKKTRRRLERGYQKALKEGRVGQPHKRIPEAELYELYVDKGLSMAKCARFFGVSVPTIRDRLESYGIPRRKFMVEG